MSVVFEAISDMFPVSADGAGGHVLCSLGLSSKHPNMCSSVSSALNQSVIATLLFWQEHVNARRGFAAYLPQRLAFRLIVKVVAAAGVCINAG